MTHRENTGAPTQNHPTINFRITPFGTPGPRLGFWGVPESLGRFRVLGEIARGGMGIVLRAHDGDLDREVAIKLLVPEVEPETEAGRHFAQEARIASRLRHPGILPVYESGTAPDGRAYFVMPLVEGETLATLLNQRKNVRWGLGRWLRVLRQVSEGMAHAHGNGVVHRDLKPGNVMVAADGTALVMDWGVATILSDAAGQHEGGCWIYGTPAYMAPEQALGQVTGADFRQDVFGLGAILCEILTGLPPYLRRAAVTANQLAEDLHDCHRRLEASAGPREVVELAARCLAVEAADRPRDAGAVGRQLGEILEKRSVRRKRCRLRSASLLDQQRGLCPEAMATNP
jgi:serine/threonine protein kinase